jgi:hypothetical protein
MMNAKKAKMLRKVAKAMAKQAGKPERETIEQTVSRSAFGGGSKYDTCTVNRPDSARGVYRRMKNDYYEVKNARND